MISAEQSAQIKELLSQAQTILIMVGPKASVDQVAAATALADGLSAAGKPPLLLSPVELSSALVEKFPEELEFQTELGNRDLSLSFEYQPEMVDKVSYHIDETNQRFYLVVKPQKGHKPLDSQTVEFSYTGAEADLIFLVGVHEFEQLDQLYFGYEQLYQDTTVVTFHTFEPTIGNVKLNTSGLSSLSEAMVLFIQELELPVTAQAATRLLVAIEESTDGFRSLATTADTFEVVAQLLRFGARRLRRSVPMTGAVTQIPSTASSSTTGGNLAEAMKNSGKKNGVSSKNNKKTGGLDYQPSGLSVSGK